MGIWEMLIVAVGVSMDAFAIAICKGLSVKKLETKHMISAGLWFGGAQALMPLIGYLLGSRFTDAISRVDHWLSFALLALIGVTTFMFSAAGVQIGHRFGAKYQSRAELAGGVILIVMGISILLEHTVGL